MMVGTMVTVKELRSRVKIHEHDFISRGTESETLLVCSTCGLLYCEKCGKLVNKRHASIERRITIRKAMNEYWSRMNTDRNISALPLAKSMSLGRKRRTYRRNEVKNF